MKLIIFSLLFAFSQAEVLPAPCISCNAKTVYILIRQMQQLTPVDSVTYKIINGVNHCYGYEIYLKGKLLVRQPSIPCVPGITGFRKKTDAEKTALLVMSKIRAGQMPPAVSKDELMTLGVLHN